ncbi:helix-turn-helix domain-containing protein [Pseudogemmobacter sonorensis]|uniref:helix-turn-helix domain-containing protein n=1 Tax=Pseudogemmobacter sonorensis TaxID=2989681 RepID=UPI0036B27214
MTHLTLPRRPMPRLGGMTNPRPISMMDESTLARAMAEDAKRAGNGPRRETNKVFPVHIDRREGANSNVLDALRGPMTAQQIAQAADRNIKTIGARLNVLEGLGLVRRIPGTKPQLWERISMEDPA